VDRKPSTVVEGVRPWRKTRLASVVTGHAGNLNASKLTAAQRTQAAQVLAQPPAAHGLREGFWSVPKLATWLSTEFGVVYESPTSYHFLLRFAGLSFHKPDPLDKRRDDDAVEAQSYIGFLNQQTGACELGRVPWQNGAKILKALTDFAGRHPGKRLCVVWDNAAWHKNRAIRAELRKGGLLERVHLIALPPYAPDHNPIEHVWKAAKDHAANFQQEEFDDTIERFEAYIASRDFNYRIQQPSDYEISAP
jgi:transposase